MKIIYSIEKEEHRHRQVLFCWDQPYAMEQHSASFEPDTRLNRIWISNRIKVVTVSCVTVSFSLGNVIIWRVKSDWNFQVKAVMASAIMSFSIIVHHPCNDDNDNMLFIMMIMIG